MSSGSSAMAFLDFCSEGPFFLEGIFLIDWWAAVPCARLLWWLCSTEGVITCALALCLLLSQQQRWRTVQ